MASTATSDLIPYSNPNLGFALESIELAKGRGSYFRLPQGRINNRAPQVINIIDTEVLPTSDFSIDTYSEAALGQVESFRDFKLLGPLKKIFCSWFFDILNHFSSFSCSADLICLSPAFFITLYFYLIHFICYFII